MAAGQARASAAKPSCEKCFFRSRNLCALSEGPCPTFRPDGPAGLVPPLQPSLLPRGGAPAGATAVAA